MSEFCVYCPIVHLRSLCTLSPRDLTLVINAQQRTIVSVCQVQRFFPGLRLTDGRVNRCADFQFHIVQKAVPKSCFRFLDHGVQNVAH